jgi:uncharacterized protein YlxP (DUF503 family)
MAVHVLVLAVDLHLPECRSLKAKRSVVKSIADTSRRRYAVAVAETDHQNKWQRAQLGVATVASSPTHCMDVIDEVERYIWSVPGAQVISSTRHWTEIDS